MSEVPCTVHVCAVIKRLWSGQWGGQDCGEGPWVLRLALDPPPHTNSVTLGELLSLPKA